MLKKLQSLNRNFLNHAKEQLAVLCFHFHHPATSIEKNLTLKNRLQYLKKNCNIIPLEEGLNSIFQQKKIPKNAVCLTVDDAVENFYLNGWPIFKELNLPFTLAVIPGLIEGKDTHLYYQSTLMRMAGHQFNLPHQEMVELFSQWYHDKKKEKVILQNFDSIFKTTKSLKVTELIEAVELLKIPRDRFMTWSQLKELNNSGIVSFASHSMSHPHMNLIGNEQIVWEVEESRNCLYNYLGINPSIFVYPYGLKENSTDAVKKAMENSRYTFAFSTCPDFVHSKVNPFLLPRFDGEMENDTNFYEILESTNNSNLQISKTKFIYNRIKDVTRRYIKTLM